MKVIEDKQNPLLKRKEVKIVVEAGKNPTMQEANKKVAEHFKSSEENVAVKEIKGKFGRKTFLIGANIYNNKEDKEEIEPKKKEKKGEGQAEEKPAEKKEEKASENEEKK